MQTLTENRTKITLGVDTHRDIHVAAVLDARGAVIETSEFPAAVNGYRDLVCWARSFGPIDSAGIEGTGSWGTGLARYAAEEGVEVVEVNRVNRQHRRRHGKSDTADAIAAARAVQSGEATAKPRGRSGAVEGLRTNRVACRSAVKARTQAINQLRSLIVTAPEQLRSSLNAKPIKKIVATCCRFRVCGMDELNTTKHTMRSLARRIQFLDTEIADLKSVRKQLVEAAAPPALLAEHGVGPKVATDLLIAFGTNPARIHSDAAFAALCGVSAVDASSGRQQRHRLNRGGDRQANNALWRIVTVRMANHPETRAYIARRIAQGKTKREAIRSLKRYTARHIWRIMHQHQQTLDHL